MLYLAYMPEVECREEADPEIGKLQPAVPPADAAHPGAGEALRLEAVPQEGIELSISGETPFIPKSPKE